MLVFSCDVLFVEATMVCLNHFGDLCACASADHCLHYRYTLTVLEEKLKLLKGRIGTYNQWVQKVEDVLSASDDDRLGDYLWHFIF